MDSLIILFYIIASIFFIFGIKKMGKTATARSGNLYSAVGMLIALVAVFLQSDVRAALSAGPTFYMNSLVIAVLAIIVGTVAGVVSSKRVPLIKMPELVALFNGFGGLSSLLVALSEFLRNYNLPERTEVNLISDLALGLTILVGAVTFTGSVLAYAKLANILKSTYRLPAHNTVNAAMLLVSLLLIVTYTVPALAPFKVAGIIILTVLSCVLGITVVNAIGGGDMPVIISLLNSFSGMAAALAGFIIENTVLIVAGCLVGASGIILTVIMCKAMNKTLFRLLFNEEKVGKQGAKTQREPKAVSVEDAFLILEAANSVVFIPGYGMAVAQAQHVVKELAQKLEDNGTECSFAVHPVAGRMPGHMNVLLAEADVDYDQLKTMEEINPQMPLTDVAVVIGANDVVNPVAETDESSPIYGMPIIKAHQAKTVFVLKRGKGKGYSGVENELFGLDNTLMLYGDAKQTISALINEFGE